MKMKIIEDKLQKVIYDSKIMGLSLEELLEMIKLLY